MGSGNTSSLFSSSSLTNVLVKCNLLSENPVDMDAVLTHCKKLSKTLSDDFSKNSIFNVHELINHCATKFQKKKIVKVAKSNLRCFECQRETP